MAERVQGYVSILDWEKNKTKSCNKPKKTFTSPMAHVTHIGYMSKTVHILVMSLKIAY